MERKKFSETKKVVVVHVLNGKVTVHVLQHIALINNQIKVYYNINVYQL